MQKELKKIIQSAGSSATVGDMLTQLVLGVRPVVGAKVCSIFLVDDARATLVLSASDGFHDKAIQAVTLPLGEGLLGCVSEREAPLHLADMHQHDSYIAHPNLDENSLHGYLAFPVFYGGQLLAILVIQQQEAALFSDQVQTFVLTLCVQLSEILADKIKNACFAKKKSKVGVLGVSGTWDGVASSAGVTIGQAIVTFPPADFDSVIDKSFDDYNVEIESFKSALEMAREEIDQLKSQAQSSLSMAENVLFDAYLRILDSRSLIEEVEDEIKTGVWAPTALKRVVQLHMERFNSLDDEYLRERATDFKDLGQRILAHLQNQTRDVLNFDKPKILVSEEITATMLLEVPMGQLLGIVSNKGSSNSHVAILARALGIPAVMGVDGLALHTLQDQELIVDGYNGQVYVSPKTAIKKEFKLLLEQEQQFDESLEALRDQSAETSDGETVELMVNTGLALDTGISLRIGARGVGLYRTEMPFMMHDYFPSEERQFVMYRQLLNAFSPLPVVMRTLDIGGDKSLSYFPVEEENPFLGWRGLRISLDHPELFLIQIRAMLRASEGYKNLQILLPMVTSIIEFESALSMIKNVYEELIDDGIKVLFPKVGIMIEVPSAVFQSYELASRVDFLSIGSNDLIQYTLAVDRNNSRVAAMYDGLHPAILRALKMCVDNARRANKKISICGEMASDPLSVPLLLAMGFDVLSMNARALLKVKWVIRQFDMASAKALLKDALKMDDAREVRCAMELALEEAGLGSLIRAGV